MTSRNGGNRILVTDDDHVFRTIARSALESHSFFITEAADGDEAILKLDQREYDLILLDLDMPRVDGFEVIRHVRSILKDANLPIMVVTSRSGFNDIDRAFELGATSFTVKPIDWNILIHQIRFILRASQNDRQLRKAKTSIEAVSDFKTNLLSVIAHEFRTPVHSIAGFSGLLQSTLTRNPGEPVPDGYLAELDAATKRLTTSLDDILFLARSVDGGASGSLDYYQIWPMIDDVVEAWREKATERQISFVTKTDVARDDQLMCDQTQFCRALTNLVSNAIKFSPENSEICVTSFIGRNGEFTCNVRDHGPGIPENIRDKATNLFAQGDMSASRAVEGLGLGLPICRAIAEFHEGRFEIESSEGQGTLASLVFPASRVLLPQKADATPDSSKGDIAVA